MVLDPAIISDYFKKKMRGIARNNNWTVVDVTDVPNNVTVLGGIFGLNMKEEGILNEVWKERFEPQENKASMMSSLVHNSFVTRQLPTRILLSFLVIFQFRIFLKSYASLIAE